MPDHAGNSEDYLSQKEKEGIVCTNEIRPL